MPPKSKEEYLARVKAALNKFEKQPAWRKRKAAMTSKDYATNYAKDQIRDVLKSA